MEETTRRILLTEAFKFAWPRAIDNLGFFIVFLSIYIVFTLSIAIIETVAQDTLLIVFLLEILSTMVDTIVSIGMITACLAVYRGQRANFDHIFENSHLFWRYIGVAVLYFSIVVGGLILFIIPGIFWGIRFSMSIYLIIDKNMKIMDALRESYRLTKGHVMDFIGYGLLMVLVSIGGLLALIVGLFISIPLTNFMFVSLYKQLLGENQNNNRNGTKKRLQPKRIRRVKTASSVI